MSSSITSAHDRAVTDQFTRQAEGFSQSRALHAQDVVDFVVDAVAPKPSDRAIDLACGPGSVVCALAARAGSAVGVDATQAMLDEAAKLSAQRGLRNIEWVRSSVYRTPFDDGAFDVVTCRFAFHHFERPEDALSQMEGLAAPGARIAVCDGIVSDDPVKAQAFNAMEKVRDPSTVAFLAAVRVLARPVRVGWAGGAGGTVLPRRLSRERSGEGLVPRRHGPRCVAGDAGAKRRGRHARHECAPHGEGRGIVVCVYGADGGELNDLSSRPQRAGEPGSSEQRLLLGPGSAFGRPG